MSSGSLVSIRIRRDGVGEGVRGSRDNRLRRCSSSYGMSIIRKVGALPLGESSILAILDRHALPEPHM